MAKTRMPRSASSVQRFEVSTDLPVPPFPEVTQMNRVGPDLGKATGSMGAGEWEGSRAWPVRSDRLLPSFRRVNGSPALHRVSRPVFDVRIRKTLPTPPA